jgi:hypothetical protein
MNRGRKTSGVSAAILIACALLVSFAQPLAALAMLDGCSMCGHDDLDAAACCCAPEAAPGSALPTAEESCCSSEEAEPLEVEATAAHECSCRSAPTCPTTPVPLPPLQDIAAAQTSSRLVLQGCSISSRTVLVFSPDLRTKGVRGGPAPPTNAAGNQTRLGRAAVQGTTTLLALLSVARL